MSSAPDWSASPYLDGNFAPTHQEIDVACPDVTGKMAAQWLADAGIITNKNTVSKDERSPFQTSGVRLGTPALTTRGLDEAAIREVGQVIVEVINSDGDEAKIKTANDKVLELCKRFPMPH